ncbi:hypothetical protein [Rothia nasimurium]|uniref:hypothetical protein n=1 Tax=Rothia nasimurium TaxID=85336 RepID=UPI001F45812D|nr:hypothetical protein [Rothia nasimurium]
MFTLFSVAETPIAQDFSLDPTVLAEVADTPCLGRLLSSHVLEVESLSYLGSQAPTAAMENLGTALRYSIERRICLWLGLVDVNDLPRIQAILGDSCQVAGPEVSPPESWKHRLPTSSSVQPIAVSPQRLLRILLAPSSPLQECTLRHLEGIDPKRIARSELLELQSKGIPMVPRSLPFRLAHSPIVWAYALIMLYSACRAIPVAFLPGFQGNIWILWGLDVGGALPYAWGVIAMFTAQKVLVRLAALVLALITFLAPYAYFWSAGQHYPFYANVIVACIITCAVGFEVFRYIREKRVRARVAQAGAPPFSPITAVGAYPSQPVFWAALHRRRSARHR